MKLISSSRRVAVALAAFFAFGALAPAVVHAQSASPPDSGDPAALVVRIDRLEDELRAANGAIEQLQNQQQKLQEQLKRFQEDVEFRLKDARSGGSAPPLAPAPAVEPPPAKPSKHSDAFDPGADPDAIGAPRPIGTTSPSAALGTASTAAGAPLDLAHPAQSAGQPDSPSDSPTVISGVPGAQPDGPREQLNAAIESYRAGQYEQAEGQLRAFLARNGRSRLVPEATFYLGESFFQRSRPREAAEQYLKLSTDYAQSPRAPEGMLRLGESLAMLGNNGQACATFSEAGRRYPTAQVSVKKSIEREMQKDHC